MYELTVVTDFAAAHHIPGHPAECRRLHGHTWKVEVTVAGTAQSETGMVVDFKTLKETVRSIVKKMDHSYLNELAPFAGPDPLHSPTAENIARHVFYSVAQQLSSIGPGLTMRAVRIWESSSAAVTYLGEA